MQPRYVCTSVVSLFKYFRDDDSDWTGVYCLFTVFILEEIAITLIKHHRDWSFSLAVHMNSSCTHTINLNLDKLK